MPEVRIVKPFRPSSSEPMRMPGDMVEVDESMLANLLRLGIVEDPDAAAEVKEPAPAEEDPETAPEMEETPMESSSGGYPAPPEKTAPVAEFKEYARRNEIKLTGLTKRNEIVGYIYKVAGSN